MEVKFEVTRESYINSVKALTIHAYKRHSLILLGIAILLGFFSAAGDKNFDLLNFSYKVFFYFIALLLVSTIASFIKSYKKVKAALKEIGDKTFTQILTVNQEGITITGIKTSAIYRWFEIKKVHLIKNYIAIVLRNKFTHLVPYSSFLNQQERDQFLQTSRSELNRANPASYYKPVLSYRRGLLGLIPIVGGFNGIIMLVTGIQYKNLKYSVIGFGGVLFSSILVLTLYFTVIKGSSFDMFSRSGFSDLTKMELNSLVKEVEFYKLQNGAYPDSLQQLNIKDEFTNIHDPMLDGKKPDSYIYRRIGSKYTLFSSGIDQIPNTADDIYPTVDTTNTGLIVKRR